MDDADGPAQSVKRVTDPRALRALAHPIRLSLLGLLASATTFPTTAPTIATLLGLGVAVDYGLFLVARHREQVDSGMDVVTSAAKAEGVPARRRATHPGMFRWPARPIPSAPGGTFSVITDPAAV